MKICTAAGTFNSQFMTVTMEMAIVAGLDLIPLQQFQNLRAGVTAVAGRVVQKTKLLLLPCRLQRRLQADQLPAKDLLVMGAFLILLKEPTTGTAQSIVAILKAGVMKKIHLPKFVFLTEFRKF